MSGAKHLMFQHGSNNNLDNACRKCEICLLSEWRDLDPVRKLTKKPGFQAHGQHTNT